jgi:hypothetical protein
MPSSTLPASAPVSRGSLILLSVILFEGGIFLALCAWLWHAKNFPDWAAPLFLHPLSRALCSALGVLDVWAACDLLAEWMVEPGESGPGARG